MPKAKKRMKDKDIKEIEKLIHQFAHVYYQGLMVGSNPVLSLFKLYLRKLLDKYDIKHVTVGHLILFLKSVRRVSEGKTTFISKTLNSKEELDTALALMQSYKGDTFSIDIFYKRYVGKIYIRVRCKTIEEAKYAFLSLYSVPIELLDEAVNIYFKIRKLYVDII